MLKNRHFIAYMSTLLLYVSAFALIWFLPSPQRVATETSSEKVIELSVTEFVQEAPPVEEKIEEVMEEELPEEEIIEEEVLEETPPEEKKIEAKPVEQKEEPVAKKALPPVVKKTAVKKPKKEKPKKITKKRVKKKKTTKPTRKASSKQRRVNPAKVNQFYKQVRLKINKHKSYPKIAKRRRMQGAVKVTFTILASGKVSNISLSGPKIFHKSARKAVQSVFPINVKNIPISLPTTVHVTLQYHIR